ncbi:MAG: glycosyltransferase family 2 protein [Bacteroidaceae bacterium]|nr:glycosyltransferase family 2 protein [Bacteroidaceae bacterium]
MKWYSKFMDVYGKSPEDISPALFEQISGNMAKLQSDAPLVTVAVIAHNEEKRLAACLWSLSEQKCDFPIEIVGVDNNSSDRTAEVYAKCGISSLPETRQSPGWARTKGLENARGKYTVTIDSDTIYPPLYVQTLTGQLMKKGVVAVGSFWSYYPDKDHSRFSLALYESVRDIYLWLLHFKRPELAVRGMVFGHDTELARKVGIRTDIIRGEDGSLALGLKQFGKIKFVHSRKARPVTGYGTMGKDGSIFSRFIQVARMRLKGIFMIFTKKDRYEDNPDNLIERK